MNDPVGSSPVPFLSAFPSTPSLQTAYPLLVSSTLPLPPLSAAICLSLNAWPPAASAAYYGSGCVRGSSALAGVQMGSPGDGKRAHVEGWGAWRSGQRHARVACVGHRPSALAAGRGPSGGRALSPGPAWRPLGLLLSLLLLSGHGGAVPRRPIELGEGPSEELVGVQIRLRKGQLRDKAARLVARARVVHVAAADRQARAGRAGEPRCQEPGGGAHGSVRPCMGACAHKVRVPSFSRKASYHLAPSSEKPCSR